MIKGRQTNKTRKMATSVALHAIGEAIAKYLQENDKVNSPTKFVFELDDDEDLEAVLARIPKIGISDWEKLSEDTINTFKSVFGLNKFGGGYHGYRPGTIWIMTDFFYQDKHYAYVFSDKCVCIGTCLVTRDANGKQHFDWDKPWFPRQEFSQYYGIARWD